MDGNELVARFVHTLTWDALSPTVQRKAKLCLLDALGATLSGTMLPISRITASYAQRAFRGEAATLLVHGGKASAAGAALANACAANGFDSDDGAVYTKGHPGAQLFPAVLAVAEQEGRSGREMLTALVAGYEVAIRAGRCWHDYHGFPAEYQSCGSWGSLATAAASAHLMHLEPEQIEHALGIAEYHAPNLPMMRDIDSPAMVKCGIGWGAFTGVTAAELAAAGFNGIPSLLGFDHYREWVSDIGERYLMVDHVWFKEFAGCGYSHTPLTAARHLTQTCDIQAEQIAAVRVECDHLSTRLGSRLPANSEQAQFNTAWPLAAFLLDGELGPRQLREERLNDERIIALVNRIELVESPRLSEWADRRLVAAPGGKFASRVEVTLKDGRRLDSGLVEALSVDYGLDWDEQRSEVKFRSLVRDVLDEERVDELIDLVWAFEQNAGARTLVECVNASVIE